MAKTKPTPTGDDNVVPIGPAGEQPDTSAGDGSETQPPDPKRPKYGRRQAPANVEKLPPKLSCGTASGRGFFVAHPTATCGRS